jgi:hypothetical protein
MMTMSQPWGALAFRHIPSELCGVIVGQQPNANPVDHAASSTRARAGTIGSQHGKRFDKRDQARASRAEAHPRQGHREREAACKAFTGSVGGVRAAAESEWAWRLREIPEAACTPLRRLDRRCRLRGASGPSKTANILVATRHGARTASADARWIGRSGTSASLKFGRRRRTAGVGR